MIQIKMGKYGYTVSGHADYAEHGKDIVCSAVSALALTGVEALSDLLQCSSVVSSGRVYLEYIPHGFSDDVNFEARIILDTIKTGFALIANQYPQHVNLEEHYE
jgi:uncharacterized protein YsxB (DUF464 family)